MSVYLLSLNHQHASIDLREKVQIDADQLGQAYRQLFSEGNVDEALIYSTCERTEVVWMGDEAAGEHWLSSFYDIDAETLSVHVQKREGVKAVDHIIQVITGLQSSMLGEPQILGQFKEALAMAKEYHALKNTLLLVCTKILNAAKKIRTDHPIGEGSTTLASSVLHLAHKIFSDVRTCKWLCLGSGDVIQQCLPYVEDHTNHTITILSRSTEARSWASKHVRFEHITHLPQLLEDADILISATRHPLPLVGKGLLERTMKARCYRPLLIADMAVPRNIEPECQSISGVYLYDIDALHDLIEVHISQRMDACQKLQPKIAQFAEECLAGMHVLYAGDTISSYRQHVESLCQETRDKIKPILKNDREIQQQVDQLIHQLTQKILHQPTQQIRKAASSGNHNLLKAIKELLTFEDGSP